LNKTYAANACETENKKMKDIYDKCKKIGKGGKGYEDCAENFRVQKEKAGQVCEDEKSKTAQAARLGSVSSPEQLEKAIQEWEQTSNTMKCRDKNAKNRNSNCSTVLQQWGQQLYTLEELKFAKEQTAYEELVQWSRIFTKAPCRYSSIMLKFSQMDRAQPICFSSHLSFWK